MADPMLGIIVAALDVDKDNIVGWNRWYDLQHLAPNVALPGIIAGHRYVATPELHQNRITDREMGSWRGGRSVFLTVYFTSGEPGAVMAEMTRRRDELEAAGRMAGAGRRVVRDGDAGQLIASWSDPSLLLDECDLPHVGHAGIRLTMDRDSTATPHGGQHVIASFRFASLFHSDAYWDLQLLDQRARNVLPEVRQHGRSSNSRLLDAGFDPISPLDYGFADTLRASSLPETIDDQEGPT